MTNAEVRSFLDRFVLAWQGQDVGALAACYTDDCVVVSPIFNTLRGRSAVEKSYADLFRALAVRNARVDDTVIGSEEPARAVVVWNVQSTHVGEVFGMPATGKNIERTVAYFLTLENGKIAKELRVYDFTNMLMQLGVLRAKPGHLG
jgi:steroid delta-isomerase-like uncharacterized protein